MEITSTIYIADDDEDDRMLLRDAIYAVTKNIIITEVSNGEELIEQIRAEANPGEILILMDMNMPKMNGIEAAVILKSEPDLMHVPIIMISTASNPQLISEAYLKGVNAFITKPYSINDYKEIAIAINTCFLRNYPSFNQSAAIKNGTTKSILIIEDNVDQSIVISLALKHSIPNVNVISIHDQASSLEFISSQWDKGIQLPQLILLDLYLPDRNSGLALLEVMKRFLISKSLTTIPIIILSHSADAADIRDCYRSQANAYMTKSSDLTVWMSFFSYLCHFWMDTIITQNQLSRH